MRRIHKAGEPAALQRYRRTAGEPPPSYAAMPAEVKDALRDALLAEQGWLCCYCMRRVDAHDCRIEHREPQSDPETDALAYRNLFAACSGRLGGARHCDVSKGRRRITLDPLTVSASWFRYGTEGAIGATRADVAADIAVLDLDVAPLRWARKAALRAFLGHLGGRAGRDWSRRRLETAAARVGAPGADGRREPFCEMLAYWLRRRIERAG